MFGYPAAFVKEHMFAGLHEDRLVLRLDDAGAAEAKRQGAMDFEPMSGRPMKGWVAVPQKLLADEVRAGAWVELAFQHTSRLPAKKKRSRAR